MKYSFCIFIGVICISVYACSKISTGSNNTSVAVATSDTVAHKDTSTNKDTSTHVTTPVTSIPDTTTSPFYRTLSVFMKQGTTWDCIRYDTLEGPILGGPMTKYYGNWQKNLVIDSSKKYSAYIGLYKDSSIETFTVKGTISFGDLKKYYSNYYPIYDTHVFYMTNYSNVVQAYDTSTCSILIVKNKTRNTIDTEFVFLSRTYFAILPQVSNIGSYSSSVNAFSSYYTTDKSLISIGVSLSNLKAGSDIFFFQNKMYQGDLTLQDYTAIMGRGYQQIGYDSTHFITSGTKGLLKQSRNNEGVAENVGYYNNRVKRINVSN